MPWLQAYYGGVASGDVKRYVGPADICMMYAVTDVQGINRISERVLSNAAHALAGMIAWRRPEVADRKPAIGLTMFGLTTPCVQAVTAALEPTHDCIVFHATGTGGQSMEKLADSGLLSGVISKVAAYGFLRIAIAQFPKAVHDFRTPILVLAAIGLVYGSLLAFRAPDIRGVVAYSSVA